jgi:hypothetical protein
MEFCYGDKNHIRILEEAEFWKRQESEHTVVIRELVGDLEEEFVEKLIEFQQVFSSTEATIVQVFERLNRSCYNLSPEMIQNIRYIIETTVQQSRAFVAFLSNLIRQSAAVKSNVTAGVVINHIIRESEYYIGIANTYLNMPAYGSSRNM